MGLAKQASVVVGLVTGVVGLFFLFFPQFRPEREEVSPEQRARIFDITANARTRQEDYFDYTERSKEGFTKEQLAEIGASAFASVNIVGYNGKTVTTVSQLVDARTGRSVSKADDRTITPPRNNVTAPWSNWERLRPGRGSYIMVMKLLDGPIGATGVKVIACGQTKQFGGLAGFVPVKTAPRVCPRVGSD